MPLTASGVAVLEAVVLVSDWAAWEVLVLYVKIGHYIIILPTVLPSSVTHGLTFVCHFQPVMSDNEYLCLKLMISTNKNISVH